MRLPALLAAAVTVSFTVPDRDRNPSKVEALPQSVDDVAPVTDVDALWMARVDNDTRWCHPDLGAEQQADWIASK